MQRVYDGGAYIIEPLTDPRMFEGVRTRRILAFLIDAVVIALLTVVASIAVAVLGVLTLGLGWLLFPLLWPGVALLYCAFTMGGPRSATLGMRAQGLEARFLDGSRFNPGIAAIHSILFYISVGVLTPFILLVSLFTDRKRLLHDLVLGSVVVRRA
jgi:uncharacterized RDD family membrane protein YckC